MSFAAGTQQRAESLDSNLRHGTRNSRSSVQSNSTSNGNRPRSTSSSKALLTLALMEAQTAVQLDNDSNITGALEAYQRAVTLLNRVMNTTSSSDEQDRLRTIHDSYLFRIQLLSTPPTPTTPSHPSPEALHKGDAPPQDIDRPLSPPTDGHSPHSPHDQEGPDPTTTPTGLAFQANLPSPRRGKKQSPSPPQPSESQVPENGPVNRPRQRSDSASVLTGGGRRHVRTHTGGSTVARPFTGDLVSAAEQLQLHAQQRIVPKGSRDRMDVPLHLAPTTPLPPTPNSTPPAKGNHQGPLSPPLPVPGPPTNNPPVPNLSANQTFLASLAVNTNGPRSQSPTSPPPWTNLPLTPSNLSASLPDTARRTSPLVPSYLNSSLPLPPLPKSSTSSFAETSLISPGTSPEQQQKEAKQHHEEDHPKKEATDLDGFYSDAALMPDEWLPTLWSKEVTVSDSVFDQAHSQASSTNEGPDSFPKDVSLKGAYTHDAMANKRRVYEKDKDGNYMQQDPLKTTPPITAASRTSYQHRHQRSYSHSSLSRGDITEPHSHQPMRSPLSSQLSTSPPGSSISNQYKRNSDSNRSSFKEGVENASGPNGPSRLGQTSGSHNNSPVGARQSQLQKSPGILRHHSSFSKLSLSSTAMSTFSSNSSNTDKSRSPSLGHGSNGGTVGLPVGVNGGTTLFEVMADDPFGGMTFPLPPPPTMEPPPADQYFRAFWLMRRLEQTMTQGGFLTRKLFVPRTIWYQSLVRLPAAESKTSACQTLNRLLKKMSLQAQRGILTLMVEPGGGVDGDQDRAMILRELEALEAATVQIQNKLSKKFSFIHRPGKHPGHPPASTGFSAIPGSGTLSISTQHHQAGHSPYQDENPLSPDGHDDYESSTTTTPVTSPIRKSVAGAGLSGGVAGGVDTASLKNQWKSFSKSVQKTISNDKVEDSSAYTDSVVSLFQSSYILEDMLKHYNALSPFQTHIQIVNRLRRLSEFLYFVVCAFVVRDLSELMSRYLKRVGTWVNE